MEVGLDILYVTCICLIVLLYSGWGLTLWLTPSRLLNVWYLLIPFTGLFLIDSVSHVASYSGLSGQESLWIMLAFTTLLAGGALVWRRSLWRWPNRFEVTVALCALPAYIFAVAPMLSTERLLPLGNTNADPILYTATTDFLRTHSMRDPVPFGLEYPAFGGVYGTIRGVFRLGFHFFQMYVDTLANQKAYATFSIVSAVGFYLWSLSVAVFASKVFRTSRYAAYGATLLFALSSLPLWIAFGGFGSQILGMGLLVMSFSLWVRAFQSVDWREMAMAAVCSAGLAGIYSDALAYLIIPTGLFLLVQTCYANRARWRVTLKIALIGTLLTLAINPLGWYRALSLVVHRFSDVVSGNVNWIVDPRQILGLIPFGKDVAIWYGAVLTAALWVVAALMAALMVYGFVRLTTQPRVIALCFVVPHLASLVWLYADGRLYGYFKGWSFGWFIYIALLAVGLLSLQQVKGHRSMAQASGFAASVLIVAWLSLTSVKLAVATTGSFAATPTIAQLGDWASGLDPEDEVYVSAGDLSTVSVYWIAYFLSDHPIHFDVPVIYTSYEGQNYRAEPWIIRHKEGRARWNTSMWQEEVLRQNEDFSLLTLDLRGGRQMEVPAVQHELNAELGGLFELAGYDLEPDTVQLGSNMDITLHWRTLQETDENYKVFIHLLDRQGNLLQQVDAYPGNWSYNTYHWLPGEVVTDKYEFPLKTDLPPGDYVLKAGLYLESTGERLSVAQDGRAIADSSILLADSLHISPP